MSLLLCHPVRFEPVSKVTQVFFDERNQQIFSVRSGGATGMMSRGFKDVQNSTFRLEDQGPMTTIKLSPKQRILAIQRCKTSVQFIGVAHAGANGVLDLDRLYEQAVRVKGAVLLGFAWLDDEQIVYFTDQSIEILAVSHERRVVKSVRSHANAGANWFLFCAKSSIVVTSNAGVLNVNAIKNGYVYKMTKIDNPGLAEIKEKDVVICNTHEDQCLVAVILHKTAESIEIHLHSASSDTPSLPVTKTHVLRLPIGGHVALNIVDNLIVVHHQSTHSSYFFDTTLTGEFDGSCARLDPVCKGAVERSPDGPDPYSVNWVTFQPDIIVDAKLGLMWRLQLNLSCDSLLSQLNGDLCKLVSFLQQRTGAKPVLLEALLKCCREPTTRIHEIGKAFDLLNEVYRRHLDQQLQPSYALPAHPSITSSLKAVLSPTASKKIIPPMAKVIIDQYDLYINLFSVLAEKYSDHVPSKRLVSILMEYYRSLSENQVPAQQFLNELVIGLMVKQKTWFQLHQLLQYHVIADHKALACLLLSLENAYSPAYQLALDMLFRLKNSKEEICGILLSKEKVMPALKFALTNGLEHIPARKFLNAARSLNDDSLYFNVYSVLKERRLLPTTGCEEYTEEFNKKWTQQSV